MPRRGRTADKLQGKYNTRVNALFPDGGASLQQSLGRGVKYNAQNRAVAVPTGRGAITRTSQRKADAYNRALDVATGKIGLDSNDPSQQQAFLRDMSALGAYEGPGAPQLASGEKAVVRDILGLGYGKFVGPKGLQTYLEHRQKFEADGTRVKGSRNVTGGLDKPAQTWANRLREGKATPEQAIQGFFKDSNKTSTFNKIAGGLIRAAVGAGFGFGIGGLFGGGAAAASGTSAAAPTLGQVLGGSAASTGSALGNIAINAGANALGQSIVAGDFDNFGDRLLGGVAAQGVPEFATGGGRIADAAANSAVQAGVSSAVDGGEFGTAFGGQLLGRGISAITGRSPTTSATQQSPTNPIEGFSPAAPLGGQFTAAGPAGLQQFNQALGTGQFNIPNFSTPSAGGSNVASIFDSVVQGGKDIFGFLGENANTLAGIGGLFTNIQGGRDQDRTANRAIDVQQQAIAANREAANLPGGSFRGPLAGGSVQRDPATGQVIATGGLTPEQQQLLQGFQGVTAGGLAQTLNFGQGLPQNVQDADAAFRAAAGQPINQQLQGLFRSNQGGASLQQQALQQALGGPQFAAQQQAAGAGALGAIGAAGQDFGTARADQLALLREQAQPFEERAFQNLQENLFSTGRLGTSGGGLQTEAFARGLGQADLQRQLAAGGEARQQQTQALGQAQGLSGLATGFSAQDEKLLDAAFRRFGQQQTTQQGINQQRFARGLDANNTAFSRAQANLTAQSGLAALPTSLQSGALSLAGSAAGGAQGLAGDAQNAFINALNLSKAQGNLAIGAGNTTASLANQGLATFGGGLGAGNEALATGLNAFDFSGIGSLFGGGGSSAAQTAAAQTPGFNPAAVQAGLGFAPPPPNPFGNPNFLQF